MSEMTSPFSKLSLSFFYFFITLMPFHVISQSPATIADQTTLLNLKKLWRSPPWTASWNSSSSPCTWPAIQCTAGTVTELLLHDKNITDTIPPSMCDLKNLTVLDVSYNYLHGDFPKVLYNCSGLQYLDLSQNFFVGPIPSDIDRLSSLQFINVGSNNFSGEIPPAISRLPELRTLHLYKNQFNEYAYTRKVNEKIDVYSFGVVLLELVTGREPNDGDEHTGLTEWAWHQYEEGNSIADTCDKDIKEPHYLEEMTTVYKLGLACTATQPSSRPSMKEVSQILRRCGPLEGSEGKKAGREYDVAPLLDSTTYLSSYKRSDEDDDSVACIV